MQTYLGYLLVIFNFIYLFLTLKLQLNYWKEFPTSTSADIIFLIVYYLHKCHSEQLDSICNILQATKCKKNNIKILSKEVKGLCSKSIRHKNENTTFILTLQHVDNTADNEALLYRRSQQVCFIYGSSI